MKGLEAFKKFEVTNTDTLKGGFWIVIESGMYGNTGRSYMDVIDTQTGGVKCSIADGDSPMETGTRIYP